MINHSVVKTMECQSERRYRRTMKMSGGAPVLQHVLMFVNKRNISILLFIYITKYTFREQT